MEKLWTVSLSFCLSLSLSPPILFYFSLFNCLWVFLSLYLSIYLSVPSFFLPKVSLFISFGASLCFSLYLYLRTSIFHPCVSLFICLRVFLSPFFFLSAFLFSLYLCHINHIEFQPRALTLCCFGLFFSSFEHEKTCWFLVPTTLQTVY